MNITGICPYETPCGWCSKWDKKCDKKIGCTNNESQTDPFMPSEVVCLTCNSYAACMDTIINHPDTVVRCIHFGFLNKYAKKNNVKEVISK